MTREVTAETILRHELAGLPVRVTAASHPDLIGIAGRVVDETTNTLHVEIPHDSCGPRTVQVPKAAATFEFTLSESPSGSRRDPDGNSERVIVVGERLVERPARRTELGVDSKWR